MENLWNKIWENREILESEWKERGDFELFCELKRLNGFDKSVDNNNVAYESFLKDLYSCFHLIEMKLKETERSFDSLYEVGCGDGVNLYYYKKLKHGKIGGIDYSSKQIMSARKLLGEMEDIQFGEATTIDEKIPYDAVISLSVFQYFETEEYARTVLDKMMKKGKIVLLGEICDKQYEEEAERKRRETIEGYGDLYKGLNRRYYNRKFFEDAAHRENKRVEFFKSTNPLYINCEYMYNCIIY